MPETIAAQLDRKFPVKCDICKTPMPRCCDDGSVVPHAEWRICPVCGHDICGLEAGLIVRMRRRRFLHEQPAIGDAVAEEEAQCQNHK